MSGVQGSASPKGPRPKPQHSKSASQGSPNVNNGKQPRSRGRGHPRAKHQNGHQVAQASGAGFSPGNQPANEQDLASFSEGAVVSSEEVSTSNAPRRAKRSTPPPPSSGRTFTSTALPSASLTDSEVIKPSASATPAKRQTAYAGPTFHASPAPSALPKPLFLSRSVPPKTRVGPPTPPLDEGSDSAPSPTPSPPSPSRAPIPVPPRHEKSPLDMLFEADRAERARNATTSPGLTTFSNSPNAIFMNHKDGHRRQESQSSLNPIFPIELDAESQNLRRSSPAAAQVTQRATTAPSSIPQVQDSAAANDDSAVIQDLLGRLTVSQKKSVASATPQAEERVPSEPSSRFHSPSPFHGRPTAPRSTSGPTTPTAADKDSQEYFYGNRNLSPLFKAAAKPDMAKRNSGLRTEVTADSPITSQGAFSPPNATSRLDPQNAKHVQPDNVYGGPSSPRRGSAPQIQPFQEAPNSRKPRRPELRSYQSRPDSYPNANGGDAVDGSPRPKPKATVMTFVPASVQARHFSASPRPRSKPDASTQDLETNTQC